MIYLLALSMILWGSFTVGCTVKYWRGRLRHGVLIPIIMVNLVFLFLLFYVVGH